MNLLEDKRFNLLMHNFCVNMIHRRVMFHEINSEFVDDYDSDDSNVSACIKYLDKLVTSDDIKYVESLWNKSIHINDDYFHTSHADLTYCTKIIK